MYSKRFDWHTASHPLSALLKNKLARGDAIVDLTASNPTRAGLVYPTRKLQDSLARAETLVYEPTPRGLAVAREAIAQYYREWGTAVSPERILLTSGTSEAYGLLFKLLADPGDEILIPRPGYPLISHLASFEGVACHSYPLRYDAEKGWQVNVELLTALVTERTRAVVVVNPNNPTGNRIKEAELAAIDALCRRHRMALIVDEVFSDFAGRSTADPVRTVLDRTSTLTFVLNGFSKILGLPQMKLGWIVSGGDAELAASAQTHLETIMDFYLSVSTPVQVAAPAMLAQRSEIQDQILDRLELNERCLRPQVEATANIRLLPREAGWYCVLSIDDPVADDSRALTLLEMDNILVHPGVFYDFHREGFVVLSLLVEPTRFHTGVERLIRRYGNGGAT